MAPGDENSEVDNVTSSLGGTSISDLVFEPALSPILLHPGITAASAEATGAALAENTKKYHCFFNDMHFHNHIAHHLLALYSLGAPPSVIKAAFEREAPDQRPVLKPVDTKLDRTNWTTHLGEEKYYPNYLSFFSSEVSQLGPLNAVKHYVFHETDGDMLNHSLSGIYHPIIHWGYGLEFGNSAIVAEGLAIAAVHRTNFGALKFNELIKTAKEGSQSAKSDGSTIVLSFHDAIRNVRVGEVEGQVRRPKAGLSAFEICHEISEDTTFPSPEDLPESPVAALFEVCEKKNSELLHWTDQWTFQPELEWSEIVCKTEEVLWLVVAMYASSYKTGPAPRKLDFFLMHCVTSSLFLPMLLQCVDKHSQKAVLIAFFRSVFAIWIAKGRPPLHLSKELSSKEANVEVESSRNWQSIIYSASVHPDEHVTKTIRTLAWASQMFGRAPKGVYGSKLPGSNELDGSIFYQAAVKTLDKHGWKHDVRVEKPPFQWFS